MSRSIPVIRQGPHLVVSIQIELGDSLVAELKDSISAEIQAREVHGLVIEVSGVDILDSYIARSIRTIAQMARLMGVRTVLAGIDASMAVTLVEMGMSMQGVQTALDLQRALALLQRESDEAQAPAGPAAGADAASESPHEDEALLGSGRHAERIAKWFGL